MLWYWDIFFGNYVEEVIYGNIRMTIFSLGNACDLETFANNTKLDNLENFEMRTINSPVVPMPTDPPFGDTKYQWKSDSAVARDMTTRDAHSNSFKPMVGQDSMEWGTVQNYGGDYWTGNTDTYNFDNKLLNNNMQANQFQPDGMQQQQVMMPNMKQQGAYMPPARDSFVEKEDFNGRDMEKIKEAKMRKIKEMEEKQRMMEIMAQPQFPKETMMSQQKSAWIALIVIFLVVVFAIMYKGKVF